MFGTILGDAYLTDERVAVRYVRFVRQHELLTADKETLAVLLLMVEKQKKQISAVSNISAGPEQKNTAFGYLRDVAEYIVLYSRLLLLSIRGNSYPRWEYMNMPFWDEILRLFDETMVRYVKLD